MLINEILTEDTPRRVKEPHVVKWIEQAYSRPDADKLYLHGSKRLFDKFNNPENPQYGTLLHFTKLTGENWSKGFALQAEYYGKYLYLVKLHYKKPFQPYSDPVAKEILTTGLVDVWDYENKIKYGRLDYQDQHLVIPQAVSAGYDFFRIHEMSIRGDSCCVPKGNQVEIVDKFI